MLIHLKTLDRARQAAKSLKLCLAEWDIERPLTWHQDTVAAMLGHSNWQTLTQSLNSGAAPSPTDETIDADGVSARRLFQTNVLIKRVGEEAVNWCGGETVFKSIARHVAVSGRPNSGTPFKTMEVDLTEDGIAVPLTLDLWTEDALLFWADFTQSGPYKHVASVVTPGAEALHSQLETEGLRATEACIQFFNNSNGDNLDRMAMLAHLARLSGNVDRAYNIAVDAFNIGSYAWAPEARDRRRRHNPVKWWDEEATRPFMRVLKEKAFTDLMLGTEQGTASGFQMIKVILTLNTSDPMNIIESFEKTFGFSLIEDDEPKPSF